MHVENYAGNSRRIVNTNWGGKGGVATLQAIEELQTVGFRERWQNKSTFSVDRVILVKQF